PVITIQPQSLTCFEGDTVFLTVTATGRAPLSYQWYEACAVPISGATSPSLRLKKVSPLDSGSFCVADSNAFGRAFSQPAIVRVLVKPSLVSLVKTQQVVNLTFSTVSNLIYSVEYSDQI